MSPEYWKLDASVSAKQRAVAVDSIDVAQLAAELAELAGLFNQEKTYTVGGVEQSSAAKVAVDLQRDLDGTAGNGERLLVPQTLDDSAELVEHVKGWPIIGGKVRAMVDWMEVWGSWCQTSLLESSVKSPARLSSFYKRCQMAASRMSVGFLH